MEDFNQFAKNNDVNKNEQEQNIFNLVSNLSQKFDGKSTNDLLKAIYAETLKGKKNGTLSNDDIDRFAQMLYPLLDDKKKSALKSVVAKLKEI